MRVRAEALVRSAGIALLRNRLYWACLIAAAFAASLIWLVKHNLNADLAWNLYAAEQLCHGAKLYRDVGDPNLPLAYLIHIPPVLLAAVLRIPAKLVFYALVTLFLAVGLLFFNNAIRELTSLSTVRRRLLILVIAACALGLHKRDFGQRDVLAGFAFIFLVADLYGRIHGQVRPTVGRYTMLVLVAIIIAVKPFFLIPWVLVIAWTVLQVGPVRTLRMPDCWLVIAITALAGVGTLIMVPSYLVMARNAAKYYSAYNADLRWIIFDLREVFVSAAILLFWRPSPLIRNLARLSTLAALGFAIEVVIQHKGWTYHEAPATLWGCIAVALLPVDLMQRPALYRRLVLLRASTLTLLASLVIAVLPLVRAVTSYSDATDTILFMKHYAQGKTVLPLATDVWTSYPAILEANALNLLPTPNLWTIPGLYRDQVKRAYHTQPARFHQPAEMEAIEKEQFDRVVDIAVRLHPAVILVQRTSNTPELGLLKFDFLKYFSIDQRFRDSLSHYVEGPSDDRCRIFIRR